MAGDVDLSKLPRDVPHTGICPSCGRCRECGQPKPLDSIWSPFWVYPPLPQPAWELVDYRVGDFPPFEQTITTG